MNLLDRSQIQRRLADFHLSVTGGCCAASRCVSLTDVECMSLRGQPFTYLNHTPSFKGQQRALPLLPSFWGTSGSGRRNTAGQREPTQRCGVGSAEKTKKGTGPCPSRCLKPALPSKVLPFEIQPSRLRLAPALRPAVTRWANRPLQAVPWVPVQRPSPAAACCRVRPSALQATSPIASSTPASANPTDLIFRPRRTGTGPRLFDPAQHLLRRGFRVYPKTQKDSSCSRKS